MDRLKILKQYFGYTTFREGQDFRPSYLRIVQFIKCLGKRPIISAFTATATENVKEDIVCVLGLQSPQVMVTGFDRKNLYFGVESSGK